MAKILKKAWVTIWDKDGDGTIDEVEVYWTIGTTDDANLNKEFRRQYTMQTTYLNPAGDLTNLGTTTINQLISAIKTNIKSAESIV